MKKLLTILTVSLLSSHCYSKQAGAVGLPIIFDTEVSGRIGRNTLRAETASRQVIIPFSAEENLLYTTARLETGGSVGTGFFMRDRAYEGFEQFESFRKSNPSLFANGGGTGDVVLITNKHVIYNAISPTEPISLYLHIFPLDWNEPSEPMRAHPEDFGQAYKICKIILPGSIRGSFIYPTTNEDMCGLNVTRLLKDINERIEEKIHIQPLGFSRKRAIPTRTKYKHYQTEVHGFRGHAGREVMMVGYPSGLWDDTNNYPIARQGSIATDTETDYQGRKEFCVSINLYGGSSGSPVIGFRTREEFSQDPLYQKISKDMRREPYFLGMVYGGPTDPISRLSREQEKHLKKLEAQVEEAKSREAIVAAQLEELKKDIEALQGGKHEEEESSDEEVQPSGLADTYKKFMDLAHVIKGEVVENFAMRVVVPNSTPHFYGTHIFISQNLVDFFDEEATGKRRVKDLATLLAEDYLHFELKEALVPEGAAGGGGKRARTE